MSRPLYFGPADRPLFGQLHDGAAGARLGLVLVNPFGYEAICAHRTYLHVADAVAAAGVPALRFDLDGTGDSAGDDTDPDRVAAWVASAGAACDALAQHSGVERVVLCGVRLGALIAAQAAAGRADVAGLIAIAPVVSGRAYVRELKILQGALGLPAGPEPLPEDLQEALGFVLTADTRAALSKIDLAKQPSPAPEVLILDRDDLPGADAWAARLGIESRKLPGYVEMMLDPHKVVVPRAIVDAVRDWCVARAEVRGTPSATHQVPCTAATMGDVTERAVSLDGGPFGILAEPAGARTGRAIVLLNSGSVHRVGPNRMWTRLARRWAAKGDVTLRLDLTGIGDAPPRAGEPENVVYGPRALEDVAAAITFLRGQRGITDVRALGLCSGAYHAFKAAVAGQPVTGVVVINPLTFFWHEGESLDVPAFRVAGDVDRYQKNAFNAAKWKKVLRGEVDVLAVAKKVGRHAATLAAARARDLSRKVGFAWREDLGAELETIAKRKVDLRFVFASDDPGLPLLRTQAGSALPTLLSRRQLHISMIDGPDHTFTPVWSHAALTRALDKELA